MRAHFCGAESVLDAICVTGGGVITAPKGRINFDDSILRTFDPFLLSFTRDGFLSPLE